MIGCRILTVVDQVIIRSLLEFYRIVSGVDMLVCGAKEAPLAEQSHPSKVLQNVANKSFFSLLVISR